MHTLTLWPSRESIRVNEDESLFVQLKKNGYHVNSICGGCASCGECVIKIKFGEDYLTPPPFEETKLIGNIFHITRERLSCQTKVFGDVSIDISIHLESKLTPAKGKKNSNVRLRKKPMSEKEEVAENSGREEDSNGKQKKQNKGGFRKPKAFKYDDEQK